MPLYEYECRQCHRRLEKIQKFSDPDLTVCPHCGGALERTITAPAVQFKGGGWYKDLYSSAKPSSAGTDSGAGASKTESKSESTAPAASAPAAAPASGAGSGS